jgi:hypothetical protein
VVGKPEGKNQLEVLALDGHNIEMDLKEDVMTCTGFI